MDAHTWSFPAISPDILRWTWSSLSERCLVRIPNSSSVLKFLLWTHHYSLQRVFFYRTFIKRAHISMPNSWPVSSGEGWLSMDLHERSSDRRTLMGTPRWLRLDSNVQRGWCRHLHTLYAHPPELTAFKVLNNPARAILATCGLPDSFDWGFLEQH